MNNPNPNVPGANAGFLAQVQAVAGPPQGQVANVPTKPKTVKIPVYLEFDEGEYNAYPNNFHPGGDKTKVMVTSDFMDALYDNFGDTYTFEAAAEADEPEPEGGNSVYVNRIDALQRGIAKLANDTDDDDLRMALMEILF
jgi:hypothetical protein